MNPLLARLRKVSTVWTALLALLLIAAGTIPAGAHAVLMRSVPAEGAALTDAPERFILVFNEPVAPLVLKLAGPDGSVTSLARYSADGAALSVEPPAMAQGTYLLRWRVISADGHPAGGSVLFSVGAPGALPAAFAAEGSGWPVRIAIWLARVALCAGLFLGAGAAVFAAVIAPLPCRASRIAVSLTLAGLAAAPLSIGLQGLDALEAPLALLARPVVWTTGVDGSYGRSILLAGAALIAAMGALPIRRSAAAKLLSLPTLAITGATFAASGHASTAPPQWLTAPAVFLHTAAVACWLGALMPLGFILSAGTDDAGAALRRFSRVIPVVLAVLAGTGVTLAAVQTGQPSALWTTAYGRVFLLKLACLAPLLALAALNRWRFAEGAKKGERVAVRRLVRAIAIETTLALAITGTVALWRFTPPPRLAAMAEAEPAALHLHTAEAMADLEIIPGRTGRASASITIMTGDYRPLDAASVTLTLSNPAAGLAPLSYATRKPGDGTWRVDVLDIPVAGRWTALIAIDAGRDGMFRLEGHLGIRP